MPKEKKIVKKFAEPSQIDKNTPGLQREQWLEGVAVGFRDNMLVLNKLLPEMDVRFDSAKYRIYSPKGYFKAATPRAETALAEQAALQYSYDTYTTEEYALEGWVSDDARRNASDDLSPLMDETEFLTSKINLTQELLIAAEVFSAIKSAGSSYYTSLGATTNWLSGASANILSDLSTAIKAIVKNTGMRPNETFMNTDTYEAVINNSTVQDILKRASTGVLTEALPVPRLRGMAINMADAVVNIGSQESPTYKSVIYDLDSVTPLKQVCIVASVTTNRLTAGRTFVSKPFNVFTGRGLEGDRRESTLVRTRKKMIPKVQNAGALYVIGNVLGS